MGAKPASMVAELVNGSPTKKAKLDNPEDIPEGKLNGEPKMEIPDGKVDEKGLLVTPKHKLSVITSQQHKDYQRDGYLLIKGFYQGEEFETLKKCLEGVQHTKEEVGGQMMWFEEGSGGQGRILNRVEDFCRRHEGMEELFNNPAESKLVKACADLIGEDVLLFKDKINFKLPGGDGFK